MVAFYNNYSTISIKILVQFNSDFIQISKALDRILIGPYRDIGYYLSFGNYCQN